MDSWITFFASNRTLVAVVNIAGLVGGLVFCFIAARRVAGGARRIYQTSITQQIRLFRRRRIMLAALSCMNPSVLMAIAIEVFGRFFLSIFVYFIITVIMAVSKAIPASDRGILTSPFTLKFMMAVVSINAIAAILTLYEFIRFARLVRRYNRHLIKKKRIWRRAH